MRIHAYSALRPRPDLAGQVAAPPYDTVDTAEAAQLAAGNPAVVAGTAWLFHSKGLADFLYWCRTGNHLCGKASEQCGRSGHCADTGL